MKSIACLRCHTDMNFMGMEKIQLGQTGFLLGALPNLLAGALEVGMYVCPSCGKLEFFCTEAEKKTDTLPQVECPVCGKMHDFDYPKCPFCKHSYQ